MSIARREEDGANLVAEAEKKLTSRGGGFFKSMFGMSSSGGAEEAAELFVQAANQFKLAKAWEKAGQALERAGSAYEGLSDFQYEAASRYADAGKAYKNVNTEKAVVAYEKAIRIHTESAKFQQCARLAKDVAEIHEAAGEYNDALKAFASAADFYDIEDAKSSANSMRAKVAMYSAKGGDYAKAAKLYEQVAASALESNMLKFGARDHLLRAGLCRVCMGDSIGSQRALERYANMDATFSTSREGELLRSVVSSVEEGDVEAFTNCVYEYDTISKLDEWKTSILLNIKNSIKEVDDDLT